MKKRIVGTIVGMFLKGLLKQCYFSKFFNGQDHK